MLILTFIALVAIAIVLVAIVLIHRHSTAACQAIAAAQDLETRDKIKQAHAIDVRFAQDVISGTDLDSAMETLTTSRTAIHALSSDTSWLWTVEDLTRAGKQKIAARTEAIRRRARSNALLVLIAVLTIAAGAKILVYGKLSDSPPVLSPLPPPAAPAKPPEDSPTSSAPDPQVSPNP